VAGIREAGATAPLRVARAFHGAWLDAFVYAEAAFTVIDPELLRLLPARILVDERGFAKTLIERVDALDQRGQPLLPEGEAPLRAERVADYGDRWHLDAGAGRPSAVVYDADDSTRTGCHPVS
jgi:hypothetical protein